MPAGIQVIGSSGVYQIDDTDSINLQIRQKGTVNLSSSYNPAPNYSGFSVRYVDVVFNNGTQPVMYLSVPYSNNIIAGVIKITKSGSTWTFRIAAKASPDFATPNLFQLTYYIFDVPVAVSGGAGLELNNSAGVLKFSTAAAALSLIPYSASLPLSASGSYAFIIEADVDNGTMESVFEPVTDQEGDYYGYRVYGARFRGGRTNSTNTGVLSEITALEEGAGESWYESDGNVTPPGAPFGEPPVEPEGGFVGGGSGFSNFRLAAEVSKC